jgi:hypothetical protein
VEPSEARERVEDFVRHFMRRYGYEENRALAVAVAAGAIVVAILLALRVLRVFPKVVVAMVVATGATLVLLGWLLLGGFAGLPVGAWNTPMPKVTSVGPLVENGVAAIVACGKKRGFEGMDAAMDYAPEPRTGTWSYERRGECTVWYHHPPDDYQREQRHQRAQH